MKINNKEITVNTFEEFINILKNFNLEKHIVEVSNQAEYVQILDYTLVELNDLPIIEEDLEVEFKGDVMKNLVKIEFIPFKDIGEVKIIKNFGKKE